MSSAHDSEPPRPDPGQTSIQEILNKVIVAHQQALTLLQQTEAAYSRLVPHQLLKLLDAKSIVDVKLGDQVERKMTIMFSDIRDFTPLSESMTPAENFEFINSYLSQMEPVLSKHGGIIDKFIGDAIMALFENGADDALRGSIAMQERLGIYNAGRKRAGYVPIHIGIALNTGMVMIGTVGGTNRMDSTVIGDAVNLAARLEEATKTYNTPLIISQNTLYDLADPTQYHIRFLDRIRVKGKSQPLSIYEVFDSNPAELRSSKQRSLEIFEQAVAYYHMKDIDKALPLLKDFIEISPDDFPAHIYLERCYEYQTTGQHLGTGEMEAGLAWKDELSTGLSVYDAAHREFMERINELSNQIRQNDCSGFDSIFTYLAKLDDDAFPYEEELMRSQNYPFAESHAEEHKRFIEHYKKLETLAREGKGDPRYLAFRTELLLLDWFSSHEIKADRHFIRFMQNSKR